MRGSEVAAAATIGLATTGAVVTGAERADDVVERAFPVAQPEHLRRRGVEPYDTLGHQ